MIENSLEKLKGEYQQIKTPDYLISNGWLDLSLKLPEKGKFSWHLIFVRGLLFASIILALASAGVGVSQAAKPGDLLFPVKVLSEKVAEKVVGNPNIGVIRRADDLIDQSNKNSDAANKASDEYKKTLEQSLQNAQKSGKTQNFKKTLEKQEQKLTDAQKRDKDSSELKKAVEETVKVQGEVKGEKDSGGQRIEDHSSSSGSSGQSSGGGSGQSGGGDHGSGDSGSDGHGGD